MSFIKSWTPDQAWAVYQLIDQIREQILTYHKETIRQYQAHEQRMDEYIRRLEQMSEQERIEEGVWFEPKEPDDPFSL